MKKIEQFPEGFDIQALYDHWLEVGRSTEPCDRPKMEAAVRHLYEFCGFKKPTLFLWGQSPLSCALMKKMFEAMTQEGSVASEHNESGSAMLFGDGYSLWNFHGTTVPREIIEHPESITVEAIFKESNSEVRRCMCEMMGWDRFVTEAKLKLVDECDDPANAPHTLKLYDVPEQVFDVPVRLLLMVNATPKRDGIVPLYGETVPMECETALSAVSWQFDVSEGMYSRLARAT